MRNSRIYLSVISSVSLFLSLSITSVSASFETASQVLASTVSTLPQTPLQAAWERIIQTSPTLAQASVSAYAYDVTKHQVLADVNGDLRQPPASLTKMVTTATALNALGPEFRYHTEVRLSPTPGGPIYLVGGGDPLLEANLSTELEAVARQVAAKVHTASQVVGVDSLFPGSLSGIGWNLGDLPTDYGALPSALTTERSEVQVIVTGTSAGRAPSVRLMFNSYRGASEVFHIINQATTEVSGSTSDLQVTRLLGSDNLLVTGKIPSGRVSETMLSVDKPSLYAAELFQDLLKQAGVHFTKSATVSSLPAKTTAFTTISSDPLQKSLKMQNQYSVNLMAENLYRMIGVHALGSTGSSGATGSAGSTKSALAPSQPGSMAPYSEAQVTSAAAKAEANFLAKAGVDTSGMQLVDGSGLSEMDEMSSRQMVNLLTYSAGQPWFAAYRDSMMKLNDAQNAGILSWRHFDVPSGSSVYVKTGNLSNQWNYAGYAYAENGDLVAFAILNDGPKTELNSRGGPLDEIMLDAARWPHVGAASSATTAGAAASSNLTNTSDNPLNGVPTNLSSLRQSLAGYVEPGSLLGLSIVDVKTGKQVYGVNSQKLMRTGYLARLAVMDTLLGKGYGRSGNVDVLATGKAKAGVESGSLVLDGHYDTLLSTANLQAAAKALRKSGITRVTGPLLYVTSAPAILQSTTGLPFSDAATWSQAGQWYAPPISQLMVNRGVADIVVSSTAAGTVSARMQPWDLPVQLSTNVQISKSAPSAVSATLLPGTARYLLTGSIQPRATLTIPVAPPDAAHVAAIVFRDALRQAGIQVVSAVRPVSTVKGKLLLTMWGTPLTTVVPEALSDPSGALTGQLYSMLGVNGLKQVTNTLSKSSMLADVTGIGVENYATPENYSFMLAKAWGNPRDQILTSYLAQHPWQTTSPENATFAAYLRGTDGSVYAVTAVLADKLWNGSWEPKIP